MEDESLPFAASSGEHHKHQGQPDAARFPLLLCVCGLGWAVRKSRLLLAGNRRKRHPEAAWAPSLQRAEVQRAG